MKNLVLSWATYSTPDDCSLGQLIQHLTKPRRLTLLKKTNVKVSVLMKLWWYEKVKINTVYQNTEVVLYCWLTRYILYYNNNNKTFRMSKSLRNDVSANKQTWKIAIWSFVGNDNQNFLNWRKNIHAFFIHPVLHLTAGGGAVSGKWKLAGSNIVCSRVLCWTSLLHITSWKKCQEVILSVKWNQISIFLRKLAGGRNDLSRAQWTGLCSCYCVTSGIRNNVLYRLIAK